MCGKSTGEWILESANVFVRDQVVVFSHHVDSLDTTNTLICYWHLAKFIVTPLSGVDDEMHFIIHLMP